ncbi:MAG: hypothetical protein WC205_07360 [Opitutaceae bacterium]|jgi:tetratricopeptide (TPR) repeat protein
MSFSRRLLLGSTAIILLWIGTFELPLGAQETTASSDPASGEKAIRKRLAETRTLLEQGHDEAAESRLAKDANSRPQTAEWFQEKAADFLRIAFSAQESGDKKTAQKAARRVLALLDKAEALSANDADTLASISEVRGYIREHLLGNTEEAIQEYKKALAHKADSPSARQKLNQLEKPSASEAPAMEPSSTQK